jgi:hypothetical protein
MAWIARIPGHSLAVLGGAILLFGVADFFPSGLAWVFRGVGFGGLAGFAWLAPGDLRLIVGRLADGPLRWYAGMCGRARRHEVRIRRYEAMLAALVIAVAGIHFGRSVAAMSRASLRVDEIGSVSSYTARGPVLAATKYNLAKNHIFFSVVNSLTPWSGSLNPARARLWSFVSVGLALAGSAAYFWRSGSPLAGAVAFALPAINPEFLIKVLEARGYGFLVLASACALAGFHGFLRTGHVRNLWLLGIPTALGTWTLPFFIVFGGGLMLLLYAVRPTRAAFTAGAGTAFAIVALYAPVLTQLARVAGDYDEKYGESFSSVAGVFRALAYAVPPAFPQVGAAGFLAVILVVLVLPPLLRGSRPELVWTIRGGAAAILGFYLFCLLLPSSPLRITAFLGMPFAFVAGALVLQALAFPALAALRAPLATVLAGLLVLAGGRALAGFEFRPDQRWMDAAAAIRAMFPGGAEIFTPAYRNPLANYLGAPFVVRENLPAELPAGALVFDPTHKPTHTPPAVRALYPSRHFLAATFPLRDGVAQAVYFEIPEELKIPRPLVAGVPSPLPLRAGSLTVPVAGHPRSLHLLLDAPTENLQVAARASAGGEKFPLSGPVVKRTGNMISFALDPGLAADAVEIELAPGPGIPQPEVRTIWTFPDGGAEGGPPVARPDRGTPGEAKKSP